MKGILAGTFDFCHAGHCAAIKFASHNCDELIIALQTDPTIDRKEKNKPIQSIFERYFQLASIKYIKYIVPYETENDLENLYAILDFDIRFIGEDHKRKNENVLETNQERIITDREIKTIYIPRFHSYSSSELRQRVSNSEKEIRFNYGKIIDYKGNLIYYKGNLI